MYCFGRPPQRRGDLVHAFFLQEEQYGDLVVRLFQGEDGIPDARRFIFGNGDILGRRHGIQHVCHGRHLAVLSRGYAPVVGAFQIILGLVRGNAGEPGLVTAGRAVVAVGVGGKERLLGKILGQLVVFCELVADGVHQPFVLPYELGKFITCHILCDPLHHLCPPLFHRPTPMKRRRKIIFFKKNKVFDTFPEIALLPLVRKGRKSKKPAGGNPPAGCCVTGSRKNHAKSAQQASRGRAHDEAGRHDAAQHRQHAGPKLEVQQRRRQAARPCAGARQRDGHKQEQRPVNAAPGLRLHLFAGFDALVVNFHKKTAQPAGQLGTPQQNRLGKQQDDGDRQHIADDRNNIGGNHRQAHGEPRRDRTAQLNDGHHGNEKDPKIFFYQCKHPFAPFAFFKFSALLFQGVLSARQGRAQALSYRIRRYFASSRCFRRAYCVILLAVLALPYQANQKSGGKHMKKLICLLAAAALLVCCALPAFAEASGVSRADYTITAYSVDATLHENNTVTQTERITVDFAVPSRGIYRVLPVALWVEKDTADGPQEMAYRARVRDLAVTGEGQTAGAPVETDTEDGFYSIRIGDEDTWLTGVQTYELTFTYDIGDDRVAAYDELFYSLNGGQWDAPIEDFRFSFTFEKPLTQEQKGALALYSGSYGGKGNEAGVSGAWDGNTFSGAAGRTLYPGEAVTLYARLPEGYFTGERMAPVWVFWAFVGAGALLAAYTLLRALSARRRAPVVTPECTPPDGVSSAEVGYIIDNSADDRDILSLILWFASKGYLAVEGREEDLRLVRKKGLPAGSPEYQTVFFDALFPAGRTVCQLHSLEPAFYEALQKAKLSLSAHFTGERALYRPGSAGRALALGAGCAVLWGAAGLSCGAFITGASVGLGLLSGVLLLLFGLLLYAAAERWQFSGRGARIGWGTGVGLCAAASAGLAYGAALYALTPLWAVLGSYLLALLACLAAPRIAQPTEYRLEMAGRLLGLRKFIEESELPRIRVLAAENPEYFYDVLPYASVFGLEEEWAGRFDGMAVPPPVWYGCSDMTVWNVIWFSHMMHHSVDHSMTQLQQTVAQQSGGSSGGGGSFGGSGGGFSGGGFGGGGGGRW